MSTAGLLLLLAICLGWTTAPAAAQVGWGPALAMWGVLALRKGEGRPRINSTYADRSEAFWHEMESRHVPTSVEMIGQTKEIGNVRVLACGMSMDLFGLSLADLEDVVDGVEGVAGFLESAGDGRIIFV
jgi:peroxiredoxin family protein